MDTSSNDQEIKDIKLPPYSQEAEDSILGALLVDNGAMEILGDKINESDFYIPGNRLIYQHIFKIINNGGTADVITVSDSLREAHQEKETGGMEYLNRLADFTPGSANLLGYADILRDRSIRRRLIKVGTEISSAAFSPQGQTAEDLLDKAEEKVLSIADQLAMNTGSFISLSQAVKTFEEKLTDLKENPIASGGIRGIRTGFPDLDRMTDGMHPGELIIVAGRPAMGKTAFALNVAKQVALDGLPVVVFSLEMSADQLASRLISALGSVPMEVLKNAHLTPEHWGQFYAAVQRLKEAPLVIDQSSSLSILSIRSRARQQKSRFQKLGLIVVDYLQLVVGERKGGSENRATELAEVSRGLKGLARELECPVIALSQVSRKVDDRKEGRRPQMSDLRESGAIEQDADVVMFLYREAAYEKTEANANDAELIIGKQRSGPTGTIPLVFDGAYTRFLPKALEYQDSSDYQD